MLHKARCWACSEPVYSLELVLQMLTVTELALSHENWFHSSTNSYNKEPAKNRLRLGLHKLNQLQTGTRTRPEHLY